MYSLHLYFLFVGVSLGGAHRILALFPCPVKSHKSLGDAFVKTLLEAGHEVTYVTPYPEWNEKPPIETRIDVSENIRLIPAKSVEDGMRGSNSYNMNVTLTKFNAVARNTVSNENVQRLLKDTSQQFDLVVAEWMFSELYAGFSAVYNCPLIWVSTLEPHFMVLRLVQHTWNPEFHPTYLNKNVLPFSFAHRLQEFVGQMKTRAVETNTFHNMDGQHYEDYFVPIISKKRLDVPVFEEVAFKASLLMVNGDLALTPAAALPPNCIYIGGYHIDTTIEALPGDLQRIMDDARHGVIYFSMGTAVSGSNWPESLIRDLLNLFGSLNQTVLWKLDRVPYSLPKNVHILPWAPQHGILKHPKCRVFITHGGLLSMTEAVHFGVPVIGTPVYADQFTNVAKAEKKGFGKSIDISTNLTDDLKVAIDEVIGNSKYKEKARQLSLIQHDHQTSPRKRLLGWVEYVVRTRGAAHLRSPALLLPWYQQWYFDIICPGVTVITLLLTVSTLCLRRKFHQAQNN